MSAQVLKTGSLPLPFPNLASRSHSSCLYAHSAASLDLNRFPSDQVPVASRVHSRPTAADMNATYQPSYASYDNHAAHNYSAAVAQPNRPKAAVADSRSLQYLRYPPQPVQQPVQQPNLSQPQQVLRHDIPNRSQQVQKDSRYSARPPTPTADIAMPSQGSRSRRDSDSLIFHSLQIPKCISSAGGNLADFAAQVCSRSTGHHRYYLLTSCR